MIIAWIITFPSVHTKEFFFSDGCEIGEGKLKLKMMEGPLFGGWRPINAVSLASSTQMK